SGVILESSTKVQMTGNVLAFNDNYGVDNAKRSDGLIITGNAIVANAKADYLEFDTEMSLEDLPDWAEYVEEGWDNVAPELQFDISAEWGALYSARSIIDRNAAEADVQAVDSWVNDVRSLFGLNLQAADLDVDSDVWLPRMSIADALAVAVRIDDL